MSRASLDIQDVTFLYETASAPVFEGLTVSFPRGWTGIIGANGSGKTTLLRLAVGELAPTVGQVCTSDQVVYCPQRTDDPPPGLGGFTEATDPNACVLRGQLQIEPDWTARWATLSHGERKRAQIAVALWRQPHVLALDEPTNHIDADARSLLAAALQRFRDIGLLVSHDRNLLDQLCGQSFMVQPPAGTLYPGGYTAAMELDRAEQQRLRAEHQQARRELKRLEREASRRRGEAAQADRRRSKRKLAKKDHDAKGRINLARVSGKDGQAGRTLRQMEGRLRQAGERLASAQYRRASRTGITMLGETARSDTLFRLGPATLPLGARRLCVPELVMAPDDRIAVTGPNGAGKSTLLRWILERLHVPPDRVVYLPQEVSREQARRIVADVRDAGRTRLGEVMTIVSCLGSDAERVLSTNDPSPGELRKILLALGLARLPHLIVMDEPTNHLDAPSIEALEHALDDCACGLLVVSHDKRLLDRLARTHWALEPAADGTNVRVVVP